MIGICITSVGFLLSVMVGISAGDIYVVDTTTNKTIDQYPDLPALFGPALPLAGFRGLVYYVSPHKACSVPVSPPTLANYTGLWIALVSRGNCSFVDKVLNVQRASYSAVIVHNVGSNAVEPMSADHGGENVMIPAVFIGQDDAMMIMQNFLYNTGYKLVITDDLPFNLQNYLLPFAITIGICFLVMLTFMIVKCVRDYRRSRRHRLSSRALKKLPIHKFKKGDPYECCAVCLEDYLDNDKLRVLPCAHAYHCKCIDPWLTKNRRVCPVCKRKVFTGDERPSDLDTDSDDESSPLINSDSGTQGGTFAQQRENPFQAAARLSEERRQRRRRRRPSRNIESGPEGYQRLADSTDESDSSSESETEGGLGEQVEENEAGDVEQGRQNHHQQTTANPGSPHKEGGNQKCNRGRINNEPTEAIGTTTGPTVNVLVHSGDHTDTSSLSSHHSSCESELSAGPVVQIAVDVVNSHIAPAAQGSTPDDHSGHATDETTHAHTHPIETMNTNNYPEQDAAVAAISHNHQQNHPEEDTNTHVHVTTDGQNVNNHTNADLVV